MEKTKYMRMIEIALAAIFIIHLYSILFFSHTHFHEGKIIIHSHPYHSSEEGATHSHTQKEIELLYILSSVPVTAQIVFVYSFSFFRKQISTLLIPVYKRIPSDTKIYILFLRPPPTL
ncbi:MAG: hypothetical protein LUG18_08270 [Candidatus Azobacteroides sp.]|nr:hypothetical protein [Candidatus Azobacteroides sp.]